MANRACNPAGMGWEQFTTEGSGLSELRVWSRLTVRQRLEALDELNEMGRGMLARRQRRGLPYIDPETGNAVRHPGCLC